MPIKVKTSGFYLFQKAFFVFNIPAFPYQPLDIKEYKKTTLTRTYLWSYQMPKHKNEIHFYKYFKKYIGLQY